MLLWTRRMQFWHARRKIFDKRPNIFGSASKIDLKSINFAEKLFSSNWTFEHIEFSFANPAKKIFTKRPKTFRLLCKKIKKKFYFSLKCCWWRKEGSFDNAAESFSTRVKVSLFTVRAKRLEIVFFRKWYLSLWLSYRHLEHSFDRNTKHFLPEGGNYSLKSRKTFEDMKLSQKWMFHQIVPKDT